MNQKQNAAHKFNALKWHAMIYAAAMLMMWYGVVTALNYSGNLIVSLDEFRPLILQRIDFTLFWGVLLIVHLGVHEVRDYQLQRGYSQPLESVSSSEY